MSERGADSSSLRWWATASLIASGLWLFFSVAPTPITTAMGLPFAILAFGSGWWSHRRGSELGDRPAVRRATWGLGLSCAGCVWQVMAVFLLIGFAVIGGTSLFQYLQGTPTPP